MGRRDWSGIERRANWNCFESDGELLLLQKNYFSNE